MTACTGCQVELRLPNRPEFVAVARLTVSAIACRMAFDVDEIEDIKVAVAEACTNAIQHGCPTQQCEEHITLQCHIMEDALTIIVQDPGDGFDPLTATRQRQGGTATLTERGLGMLLIESLMDEVTFSSNPGSGTQVRMMKRLNATKAEVP